MRAGISDKARVLIIAGSIAAGVAGGALAGDGQAPGGARGGRGFGVMRRALASLDLTQDQKDKIRSAVQAERPPSERTVGRRRRACGSLRGHRSRGRFGMDVPARAENRSGHRGAR